MPEPAEKLLIKALKGEKTERAPIWMMRQAGRYLPEYRELREEAGSFLDLCYTPDFATEVTLQPLRRFGFDAAILFSDILVVPHGLGQSLWFEEGEGPKLAPLENAAGLAALALAPMKERLAPVYEAVSRIAEALDEETALIGFAGAPWTLATYMIEGGTSKQFVEAKRWAYGDPEAFARLIALLEEAVVEHLSAQIEAGAEAVQIFDSWAGALAPEGVRRWSLEPLLSIASELKARHPGVPVIVFPRGIGPLYSEFAANGAFDALSIDTGLPAAWAHEHMGEVACLQGNLDPIHLVTGGPAMEAGIDEILAAWTDRPFVFNLGHGITPQSDPRNVWRVVEKVKAWRRP